MKRRNDDTMKIGEKIAELRKGKGLTQEDLIEIVGDENMSIATLRRIESGRCSLNLSRLSLICEALECDIRDVIKSNEKEDAIKAFYTEPNDEESLVKRLLMDIQLFYPNSKDHPFYAEDSITNLVQFWIYLPLFDQEVLADCTSRLDGDVFGREMYVMDLLARLYRSIPEGEAKQYADMQASLCTQEYFIEYHTHPETWYEKAWRDETQKDELHKKYDAYRDAIKEKREVFEALRDLKIAMDKMDR